jgi:phosphoribosylamine---glycine ligase
MKVLVIGSGGREHTICWKLKQSEQVTEIYAAPGSPGIAEIGENTGIKVDDLDGLVKFAKEKSVDLTIVGPEYPLSLGVVDAFQKEGLRIFGPTRKAAQLESSKKFAKEIMVAAGVPTAAYETFSDKESALSYLKTRTAPIVLKADGLAAGKGVFVCHEIKDAELAVQELFDQFKSSLIVIEDYLVGPEASYIVAVSGNCIVPFAASHDYKRIRDNDEGPNTGGMGTVSPTPHLTAAQEDWVLSNIIGPVVEEMEKQKMEFSGFLYAGLVIAPDGDIKVLEFNVRMGDPECQVILRRMKSDLFSLLYELSDSDGEKNVQKQEWSDDSAVCVVLASSGYPENPLKGDEIKGIEEANTLDGVVVFHAGTGVKDGKLVTAGGRVLNVTATGSNLSEARANTYQAAEKISWKGVQFRKDIGLR